MKKRKIVFLALGAICSIALFGCAEKEKIESFQKIEVLDGAIIEKDKDEYYNLNLKDRKYTKNNDNVVVLEDTLKSQLIFEEGKHYILYNNKKVEIPDGKYNSLNLSANGSYLAYMVYEDGYNLKIIDVENDREKEINSKVRVSGTFFDFIDDYTLVYYGISEDNKNGIFTYNLKEERETLVYELKEGYIEFLKVIKDKVIFLEQKDEEKSLKEFDIKNKNTEMISNEVKFVYDIEENKEEYFLLGNIRGNGESLYKLNKDGISERLVYDFPRKIDMKKGLSKTKEEGILFIGNEHNTNNVYEYKENEIKLITEKEGIYEFVKKD
ncbi:MAG: hypothetical protein ACRC28_14250 [Clostridium sp.]|uniref:hypothetical protein n=1 Tax=Clostridium sp. TaxID=1506 RepID=UPI003F33291F